MILDELVAATQQRLSVQIRQVPPETLQLQAESMPKQSRNFAGRLRQPGLHIIGELKQASPSKGQIVTDFPYLEIAKAYAAASVDAISVLTEPTFFKGKLSYLSAVREVTDMPLLRKDFIISSYMIYEAKVAGANLILLIVRILSDTQLKDYLELAQRLGLEAIVEAHDATEVKRALAAGATIIGLNNRNLQNFTVDLSTSLKLRRQIPAVIPVIAESGIKTAAQIALLAQANFNGVLIGETFMKARDKSALVRQFKAAAVG